jgi:CRP-like cAMP-binding protein
LSLLPVINHIQNYTSLSNEALEAINNCLTKTTLYKNDYLLKEGNICRHLYFLEKGLLRGYYNLDGKEITHWFSSNEDFVTSFFSFTTQQTSVENIQAIENCELYGISKQQLNNLCSSYHEIEKLVRIAYEKYYIRLEDRFVNAQFKTAKERYNDLLLNTPQLLERAPLGHIASYLGISQETLSRIRSKY